MSQFLNPIAIIAILVALSVHEWAHGFIADRLGDPTARDSGRLTLNPLAHLDPVGTILFLVIGFGWGKPVPINPNNFRSPKRDTALTALAGPVSNLVLAIGAFVFLLFAAPQSNFSVDDLLAVHTFDSAGYVFLIELASYLLFFNLGLMAFNLLPIAPLDGSKVIGAFVPLRYEEAYAKWLQYGPWFLLGLLLAESIFGIPFITTWIESIMGFVLHAMEQIVGK